MEITDIRIRKVDSEGKLKAYVTVTFDGCFVVHNVKVIEGRSGVFIAMPSRRTKNGEYKDVAHPINTDFRAELQDRILAAYESETGETAVTPPPVESEDVAGEDKPASEVENLTETPASEGHPASY